MAKTILVVDDEASLREVLDLYLGLAGFEVLQARDGLEALNLLQTIQPDLMILDVMMPGLDGFGLIQKLGSDRSFPIVFLSARGQVSDRILGLQLGGDDYIPKPFDPGEVVARVQAVLRRTDSASPAPVRVGDLVWYPEDRLMMKKDRILDLRAKEYQLMALFMKRPGKVFTKREIYETLWEEDYFADDNTIMVHISRLREKIEDDPKNPTYILTIRGLGYMLAKEVPHGEKP